MESKIKKIVLFGPESTGKSLLAMELSKEFKTTYAEEYARFYLENKKKYYDFYLPDSDTICTQEDILPIVLGQLHAEQNAHKYANEIVFYDTNPLQTKVYVKYYYQTEYKWLNTLLSELEYDYYLLCNLDVPWIQDPLRDRPQDREYIFAMFENELKKANANYGLVSGTMDERLKCAKSLIQQFVLQK